MRMRKKATSILLVLSMLVTLFASGITAFAATSSLDVKFSNNGSSQTAANTINANFQVTNNGSSAVNLADLKLRYYYTKDKDTAQNFYCDHAATMGPNSSNYTAVTSSVKGAFVNMSSPISTADTYIEVSFTSGSIPAGGTLVVQTRSARTDWSNYDMSNDYSFVPSSTYASTDKVTAFLSGSLVSGKEPNGGTQVIDPTIAPTSGTFDKAAPADLSTTLTANGNTFAGIKDLTKGTDYTVSGDKVTISKNYLSKLANGTYKLTFDFGVTNNPVYTVTVKGEQQPTDGLSVTIGTASGKAGDTVTVPVTFKDVAKVGKVGTFNFYVGYDAALLKAESVTAGDIIVNPAVNFSTQIKNGTISFVFLDNTIGDELISSDGVLANIKFTILGTAKTTTAVKFNEGGAFGDGNMSKISNVKFTDGSVAITDGGTALPVISPATATYDQAAPADVKVTYTANGNTFKGITGLTSGTDYTVSGTTVTILKSYLAKQALGTKSLTFDFGVAANPVLTLKIINSGSGNALSVKIGTAAGKTGETVTLPITMADVAKAGNVGTFNFYVGYDSALLKATKVEAGDIVKNAAVNFSTKIDATKGTISFVFLDNTIGDELITEDGILANITFEITGTQKVTTPVKFNEGGAFGDGNMAKISSVKFTDGSIAIDYDGGQVSATIAPTTVTVDLAALADVNVTLTPNGNTFAGITGLTKGTDYTVSGNTVTISKSYLSTLAVGTKTLTFDFGTANNPVLTIKVIKTEIGSDLNVKIGTAAGKTGETVTVPVTMANVAKVGNVGTFNFYVGYDSALLKATKVEAGDIVKNAAVNFSTKIDATKGTISFVFLDNTIGDELITEDGILANITFEITGTQKVTTPVKFNEGGAFGDGDMAKITKIKLTDGSVAIDGDGGQASATIAPTTVTVDLTALSDVNVTLTPNGNTFAGITGLTKGTDYTVSGNTVTISKSYLSTLAVGTKTLTFDFGTANNPVLTIKVIKTEIGSDLNVKIGTAAGKKGDVVTVPITFANVAKVGNVGTFNFYVGYDSKLLKATKVTAGDIVVNAAVNFSTQIKDGTISFVFLDGTIGDELITADGVLADITFEILGQYDQTTPVVFNQGGAFGDGNMSKITNIKFTEGSVDIDGDVLVLPATITPTTATFDKYAPADIKVTMTPNGNTFAGITGLTKGTDYTVSGNTVTILKSYLSTLTVGSKSLTFDFGTASNPVLKVTVTDSTPQVTSDIQVQYHNNNSSATGNTITGNYKVINKGSSALNLADLKLRYYFTADSSAAFSLYCDHAAATDANGGNYTALTSAVKGSFVKMSPATSTADTYLEISFSSGSIPAGGSLTIQTRVAKTDWSNFDMSNDYSYKAAGSYQDWETITAYLNGKLVSGKEPVSGPVVTPATITPTTATFDKYAPKDVVVTMTPNGNTFAGITGLKSGIDYTVSDNTVAIKSSYLGTLAKDTTKTFTFDFGTTSNPTLKVTIKDSTPVEGLDVTIGTATGTAGDTVIIPVTFANVAKAGNVGTFNFYVGYDKTLLKAQSVTAGDIVVNSAVNFTTQINAEAGTISFVFLDNTIGDELITKDGVLANIKFTVLGTKKVTTAVKFNEGGAFGNGDMAKISAVNFKDGSVSITEGPVVELGVALGTATGTAGDTVTVPVTFADVAKVGNVGTFNFYVGYDAAQLEALSVEAGDIVVNPAVNFSTKIDASKGTISFVFLDNTIGDELIAADGVLANIKFKVLGTKETTTTVKFNDGGAFGDGDMAKISSVKFTNGSVAIKTGTVVQDPAISPVLATFDKYVPADIKVTLTANGNTFKGITGLVSGTDYTVSGSTVTISKTYLSTLSLGMNSLTFDFGTATSPVLKLTVTDSTPVPAGKLSVEIGTASGKAGDTITVPVTMANVAKVGNVGTFNFYVGYDSAQLKATKVTAGDIVVNAPVNFSTKIDATKGTVSFVFLDNTIGDELIAADGVLANITFEVLGTAKTTTTVKFNEGGAFGDGNMAKITSVELKDGSVSIEEGTTVVVPATLSATTATFDKYAPADISVTYTANGNTFAGITGLTKGTDYTVSGSTVTISKSYLSTLAVGTKALTFDFGTASNPVLTVTVKDSTPVVVPATLSATTATFDKYAPADISVTYTANGNTFAGITGLTKGTDYTVSGSTVTISKSYLSTLAVGTKALTFDFGTASNPVLTVTVKDSTPVVVPATLSATTATFDKYTPADVAVTYTANGNTFAGITGLTKGTDYTVSGSTVTISKSYLSTLAVGTKALTFDFGTASNPVLTVIIKDSTPVVTGLAVAIGTAAGNTGDTTVTIPITLKNVSKVGDVGTFNFYMNYDPTLLKATKVTAGDIVVNAPVNFSSKINATAGTISFVFLDNTIGDELITTDGVLANITFTVLGTSTQTAAVSFTEGGAFGDGNMSKIKDVTFTNGSVKLN